MWLMIALIVVSGMLTDTFLKNKKMNMKKIEKEIELEKLRLQSFDKETEKLKLELQQEQQLLLDLKENIKKDV